MDIIIDAPYIFFIEGMAKPYSLRNVAKGLEYSKIPTKTNAYTYVGNAIERLKDQLKNL
tara:strand:+ start:1753 stop:1929 length:177 start_codon:yes stop_codon:yes gene_type:complete